MMHVPALLLIASILIACWYVAAVLYMIRKKGVDPTLLTYAGPLQLANYRFARFAALVLLISVFAGHEIALVVSVIIFGFAACQIGLLLIFDRKETQPVGYYLALTCTAVLAMLHLQSTVQVLLVIICIVLGELLLRRWKQGQSERYRQWVARKAMWLNHKYQHISVKYSQSDWFHILHFAVTESIARPYLSRIIERCYFYLARPASISTGIMQVQAETPLSDEESMRRGAKIIYEALHTLPPDLKKPDDKLKWLANSYIGGQGSMLHTKYYDYLKLTYPGLQTAWENIKPK